MPIWQNGLEDPDFASANLADARLGDLGGDFPKTRKPRSNCHLRRAMSDFRSLGIAVAYCTSVSDLELGWSKVATRWLTEGIWFPSTSGKLQGRRIRELIVGQTQIQIQIGK